MFPGGTHKVLNGEAPCRRPTPYPFHIPMWQKRYPFRIPSTDKWCPFHIPSIHNSAFLLTAVNTLFFKQRILHGDARIRILFSSGKTIFYERASSSRRVMFFLLYTKKDSDKIMEGNYRNYVIDKLTCEIMENKPLGSRM